MNRRNLLLAGIAATLFRGGSAAAQTYEAVSYTHLDVYKRQVQPVHRRRALPDV